MRPLLLILLSTAAWAEPAPEKPDPSAAYAAAMAQPVGPKQRALLVPAAKLGSLEAAARMIQLGMFAEMAQVDPRGTSFSAWMARRETVLGYSPQHVYGVVLANWAARNKAQLRDLWPGTMGRARAFLIGQPARQAMIGFETAWHWHDFEPRDEARAKEAFDQALALPLPEEPAAALAVALEAAGVAAWNGYAERVPELLARARAMAERDGGSFALGTATVIAAMAEARRTGGDAAAALRQFLEAARIYRVDYPFRRGLCLMEAASRSRPGHAEHGTWSDALAAYGDAARSFERAGDAQRRADALGAQAGCLRPDANPHGSWDAAAKLYLDAAAALAATANTVARADALAEGARCSVQHDSARMDAAARPLFLEAIELYRAAGLEDQAAECEVWLSAVDGG